MTAASPFLVASPATAVDAIMLKEAKLIIEYNATDNDTGFQGFFDADGWQSLVVAGPEGEVMRLQGLGQFGRHGLTELFFETVEPAETDMPMEEVLRILPEGDYTIQGVAIEADENLGRIAGAARLTHKIPAGPELVLPAPDAVVAADDGVTTSWRPVEFDIHGDPVTIMAYQLIIGKDEDSHPDMIGKMGLSMYLPPSTTTIEIPKGFLEPETTYEWEVLAIEESGNQTLSSRSFRTE